MLPLLPILTLHTSTSLGSPDDYCLETNFQKVSDRKGIYLERTSKLRLSFKEQQLLGKILNKLSQDRYGKSKSFDRFSDDMCRDMLEILHNKVGEECHIKLIQAEFETVSSWSYFPNARAKDKLCALKEFLDNASINFARFSTRELKAIRAEINDFHATELRVNIDQDVLTIRQTFLHGRPEVSIQYDDCPPCVSYCSLEELTIELNGALADRAEKKYGTTPPVRKLNFDEVRRTVDTFRSNMKDWKKVAEPKNEDRLINIDPRDFNIPQNSVQERWNKKLDNTLYLLNLILWNVVQRKREHREYYAYEINNCPVGMMVLDCQYEHELYVDRLVAHPGSEGVGGSLMEFAVMQSVESGKNGCLRLRPIDSDATQAYLSMGFEIDGNYMKLNPEASDKWRQNESGQWKLKNHMDKRYMRTGFDSDTVLDGGPPAERLPRHNLLSLFC